MTRFATRSSVNETSQNGPRLLVDLRQLDGWASLPRQLSCRERKVGIKDRAVETPHTLVASRRAWQQKDRDSLPHPSCCDTNILPDLRSLRRNDLARLARYWRRVLTAARLPITAVGGWGSVYGGRTKTKSGRVVDRIAGLGGGHLAHSSQQGRERWAPLSFVVPNQLPHREIHNGSKPRDSARSRIHPFCGPPSTGWARFRSRPPQGPFLTRPAAFGQGIRHPTVDRAQHESSDSLGPGILPP